MFKYIKKLTSVVVMFAVIIVFSSSNVYAEKENQRNNPLFLMFAYVISVDAVFKNNAKKLTDEQRNEIVKQLDNIGGITPFRKGKIQLSQKDMKEYFDCIWNDLTAWQILLQNEVSQWFTYEYCFFKCPKSRSVNICSVAGFEPKPAYLFFTSQSSGQNCMVKTKPMS